MWSCGVCGTDCVVVLFFFFFQAEDGIRDIGVTGVQTCALPISTVSLVFNDLLKNSPKPSAQFSPGNEGILKMFYFLNQQKQDIYYKVQSQQ